MLGGGQNGRGAAIARDGVGKKNHRPNRGYRRAGGVYKQGIFGAE